MQTNIILFTISFLEPKSNRNKQNQTKNRYGQNLQIQERRSNEYLSNPKNDIVSPEELSKQAWGEVQSVNEKELFGEDGQSFGRGRGWGWELSDLGLWVGRGLWFGEMPCFFLLLLPCLRFSAELGWRNGGFGFGEFLESVSSDHSVGEGESENLKWGLKNEERAGEDWKHSPKLSPFARPFTFSNCQRLVNGGTLGISVGKILTWHTYL